MTFEDMTFPLVSIIMPSFNQADYIQPAIESILSQSYSNLELIIQDGGSTDGTLEILNKYPHADARVHWSSAPDEGPAPALNAGFCKARGEFIGWLNSDDLYCEGAIAAMIQHFARNPAVLLAYGHGEHVDQNGRPLGKYPSLHPGTGLSGFRSGCFICQPTAFFKTVMFTMLGPLNTEYKTAFDYEYWIRAFRAFPDRIGFVDSTLAQSRLHPDCITMKMRQVVALEGLRLGESYLGGAEMHWATTYLEELRASNDAEASPKTAQFLQAARPFLSGQQYAKLAQSVTT